MRKLSYGRLLLVVIIALFWFYYKNDNLNSTRIKKIKLLIKTTCVSTFFVLSLFKVSSNI
jgi:hypothetical protein